MAPRFVAFERRGIRGRRWYFRFQAGNGETVFQSEAYNSARARDHGIAVARQCASAPVEVR